jgi:predicted RNA-binding protein YlqC (UPF0109 family)
VTRALVEYVAPWLVDHPDEVQIDEVEGEHGELIVEVSVHPDDVGKLIGRNGRMIRALRALAKAAGGRERRNVTVEVID